MSKSQEESQEQSTVLNSEEHSLLPMFLHLIKVTLENSMKLDRIINLMENRVNNNDNNNETYDEDVEVECARSTSSTVSSESNANQATFVSEEIIREVKQRFEESKNSAVIRCDGCNVSFIRNDGSFGKHLKQTKCKPYHCEICGRKFRERRSLIQHINIHCETAQYECSYPGCEKSYRQKHSLSEHQKKVHPGLNVSINAKSDGPAPKRARYELQHTDTKLIKAEPKLKLNDSDSLDMMKYVPGIEMNSQDSE